ncbi:hypothetical protein O5537_27640, partial [Escherichia coli]|nr:hypothetical protein [Escherichia coli]
ATGIKNLLLSLTAGASATKSQREAFKQLGFTSKQVAKSMQLNADETIRVILSKISKLPKHMQAATLSQMNKAPEIKQRQTQSAQNRSPNLH